MSTLELQKGIIYGPIASRRLGRSLGINLSPVATKVCSFDCVYCQYGPTSRCVASMRRCEAEVPSCAEVVRALSSALAASAPPDYITFSGNGEPTLHPAFADIVAAVRAVRDERCPTAKLAVLSNASALTTPRVRDALGLLDTRIMKLDAGTEGLFAQVNRPALGISFADVLAGLEAMDHFTLQSCFVSGEPSNAGDAAVADYVRAVAVVRPDAVQIYTTDRPVARPGIMNVPRERLAAIARLVCEEAGVPGEVF